MMICVNYARTIKDKVMENDKVIEQVNNNTKEQAMMGGFTKTINDAVIGSLDAHQNLATQVLGENAFVMVLLILYMS